MLLLIALLSCVLAVSTTNLWLCVLFAAVSAVCFLSNQ